MIYLVKAFYGLEGISPLYGDRILLSAAFCTSLSVLSGSASRTVEAQLSYYNYIYSAWYLLHDLKAVLAFLYSLRVRNWLRDYLKRHLEDYDEYSRLSSFEKIRGQQ